MQKQKEPIDTAIATFLPELQNETKRQTVRELIEEFAECTPWYRYQYTQSTNATSLEQDRRDPQVQPSLADLMRAIRNMNISEHPSQDDPRFIEWFLELTRSWTALLNSPWQAALRFPPSQRLTHSIEMDLLQVIETQLFRCVADSLEKRRMAGDLSGVSSAERFDDFYRWLSSAEGCEHFEENYGGQVVQAFHQLRFRCDAWCELLVRLNIDLDQINAHFFAGVDLRSLLPQLQVQMGAGDSHCRGRAVAIVNLGDHRFVYKPRDLSVDQSLKFFFDELREWTGIQVSVPSVIVARGYGWAEFVTGASGDVDFQHYGRALGFLASIEFLAGGIDFHYENVVGTADSGVSIIDAETCVGASPVNKKTYASGSGSMVGAQKVFHSVISTGLLPLPQVVPGRIGIIDVGATGITEGETTSPFKSLLAKNPGSDLMHIAFENLPYRSENSNPQPRTTVAGVVEFRDQIVGGVREGLEFAKANKEELCGLFERAFSGQSFRFINTPTQTYSQLLRMVTSPGVVNDPVAHVAVLSRCEMFSDREKSAAAFEVEQMLDGDVPYFQISFGDNCLYGMEGEPLIDGFFEGSPKETIFRRIHELDDESINEQVDLCMAAFARSLPVGAEGTPALGEAPECSVDVDVALQTGAELILARGCRSDNDRQPSTFWGPQISVEDSTQWTLGTAGYDLYGGSPGVALALSASERRLRTGKYGEFAETVFGPISHQILDDLINDGTYGIGGYMGVAGTLWAAVWDRRLRGLNYGDIAVESLNKLSQNIEGKTSADFVVGQSGALAVAVNLARMCSDIGIDVSGIMETIVSYSLPVLEKDFREGWIGTSESTPYSGFAHGLAGSMASIAAATTVLSPQSSLKAQAEKVVQEMIDALEGVVDNTGAVTRSKTDQRKDAAWCHGSPGVLLGFTIAWENGFRTDPEVLHNLAQYVRRRGVGNNSTVCHGDLGSLRVLKRYAELVDDEALAASIHKEIVNRSKYIAVRKRTDYQDKYSSTDSLMLGRAGAILTLLHELDPREYPDVTSLGI
ncbi:type 2 lantipeptide synthetase LanM [Corynebacterium sp. 320]|uniref:type 2 lanthipeptide synthetase LanM n=1 Tax=Corynebacterium TaxID=1716 RepID=UPI00125CB978|nr:MULTISPECIES: type 2 lanthipeptide synthetase LanM [Corynebacterium]KAB1502888.1 type 2 lantipeptide synthetase LanM [Corynebacterium sp. 320]KAB1552399.1 type 2 lantipeptide synthetase LanM [Corynebacterium sp. 321]KAB1554386.1 type 2 lantipeptide synthetase LanM [Corynebacterium sp. 319]KAB3526551.1 type 2 lantipeptide synthetase LanM [Corynebacterium sp. 250]KAB3539871.1 type 2 lantipeptide synthetase LanM [Corynebacterium sp. 366]